MLTETDVKTLKVYSAVASAALELADILDELDKIEAKKRRKRRFWMSTLYLPAFLLQRFKKNDHLKKFHISEYADSNAMDFLQKLRSNKTGRF